MKNLFVSYALAEQLKAKGFNELCIAFYGHKVNNIVIEATDPEDEEIRAFTNDEHDRSILGAGDISAPSYQEVVDWFMEKHLIFISVRCEKWLSDFCGRIETDRGVVETETFNDYYQALNKAIEKALKLI